MITVNGMRARHKLGLYGERWAGGVDGDSYGRCEWWSDANKDATWKLCSVADWQVELLNVHVADEPGTRGNGLWKARQAQYTVHTAIMSSNGLLRVREY